MRMTPTSLSLGADPEIFVVDKNGIIPAYSFLPSKDQADIYWDGFQAEWKYEYIGTNLSKLIEETRRKIFALTARAKRVSKTAQLVLTNVMKIDRKLLMAAPEHGVALGCKRSENAYGLEGKITGDPRKLMFRVAGGHLHFGGWTQTPEYQMIVKNLDRFVGIWSVGAAEKFDSATRREYYGLPGEYRMPHYRNSCYGVEYRTLSNFWLCHPTVMEMTWELARHTVGINGTPFFVGSEKEVVNTIKMCDISRARKLLKQNQALLYWALMGLKKEQKDLIYQLGMEGVHRVLALKDELEDNWS